MTSTLLLLLVKSSLLFGTAAALAFALRARSAALRHMVWSMALTSALALPLLSLATPAWRLALLPSAEPAHAVTVAAIAVAPSEWRAAAAPARAQRGGELRARPMEAPALALAPIAVAPVQITSGSRLPSRATLAQVAAVVWLVGSVLMLLRILLTALAASRMAARAERVDGNPVLRRVLADVSLRCAACDAELRVSDDIDVPMVWGLTRPVVLLPYEAVEWSSERRLLVLEHELSHVQRKDVWTHVMARVARAVYWVNPLAWHAERELRLESEQACDDAVLARGVRPTRYAEELLEIARMLVPTGAPSLAPGFASRPRIERRLRALLDPHEPRPMASRVETALAVVGVLLLALPLAAMRPALAPQAHAARALHAAHAFRAVPALHDWPKAFVVRAWASSDAAASASASVAASAAAATPATAPVDLSPQPTCVPDGGSSNNMTSEDGGLRRWEVHWTGRDCFVDLRSQGKIEFTDDLADVRSIAPGGWLDVSVREGDRLTRLYVTPGDGGTLDRRFTVNGAAQPWNAAARQWFAGLIVELDRRTAFAVDIRLPRLLAQGGPNAVLDEAALMTGDYARGIYLRKLLDAARLDHAQVLRVIELAGGGMKSDYEIAQVLGSVATRYGLPDAEMRSAFLRATDAIHSDYEHNRTLHALLDRSHPTDAEAGAILASASKLQSDYELARTLVDLVGRKLVPATLFDSYLADATRIHSDYERSRSLRALLGAGDTHLSDAQVGRVIAAAAGIQSDYERASVLAAVAGCYDLEGGLRSDYERAASAIKSEYERNRALGALRRTRSG